MAGKHRQEPQSGLVNGVQLAAILGTTPQAVHFAWKAGRISRVAGKLYDAASARRDWAANTNESKPRNRVSGNPKTGRAPMSPTGGNGGAPTDFSVSHAQREAELATLARLEREEVEGRLVDAADVEAAIFDSFRTARDALLALADDVCIEVAAESDPAECRRLILAKATRIAAELREVPVVAKCCGGRARGKRRRATA